MKLKKVITEQSKITNAPTWSPEPLFQEFTSKEDYDRVEIVGYEPMTAKELDTAEKQDTVLSSEDYYIEEKFDGTRALVYFLTTQECQGVCRVFSRRVSAKTGFYVENTDSLPHIRDTNRPELAGTVLDGEMFINGRPFKDVSSTLLCTYDKAINRQIELGFISFHAFDILFYKDLDLRGLPLYERKVYLHEAIEEINNKYMEEVVYQSCGQSIDTKPYVKAHGKPEAVWDKLQETGKLQAFQSFNETRLPHKTDKYSLSPRAFYEYIIATGGEGVIIKPKNGMYLHKRGWEYSKIKKFLTKDLIVLGFSEPTKEYTGKDLKHWNYWERKSDGICVGGEYYAQRDTLVPVTKHYFNKQVGNLRLGVIVTEEELNSIPKNKRGELFQSVCAKIRNLDECYVMEVCECAGFDEYTRELFTASKDGMVGTVVEVKANELMRDSGRLRHPRFMRMRGDKESTSCTWKDHIGD